MRFRASLKLIFCIAVCALFANAESADLPIGAGAVTVVDDAGNYILSNGILTAKINQRSGTLTALKYKDVNLVDHGYWSQVGRSAAGDIAKFGKKMSASIRTDPAQNSGARVEVSCKFGYDPSSPKGLPCDVELRFSLGKGESALYVYAVWEHKPNYPEFSVGEGRMALKLNPKVFDFLGIDERRLRVMPSGRDWDQGEPLNLKEARRMTTGIHKGEPEHKYDYSAILGDTPAYGWASTTKQVGLWLINPSIEYLAGGPTKVELTGHLDVNTGGEPTLLNMWHGSHYGGSSLAVVDGEAWSKFIGPFALYCNSAPTPEAMWKEAQQHAQIERQAWPYAWLTDPLYPSAAERGTVTGKLALNDPQASTRELKNLQVGLASAPYKDPSARRSGEFVDWQRDSRNYQFWTKAVDGASGAFTIRNIRPGTYTLYAIADGVLGEFAQANIVVAAGKTVDLGALEWKPVRFGKQLWELGVANRSAEEFRHGDDYWHWGLYNQFPAEFPNGVNFVIGKSDFKKDWNFAQMAHDPQAKGGRDSVSTWSISFDLADAPHGKATLRLAIAGSRLRGPIEVLINDKSAGNSGPLPDTGVLHRDGIRGYWCERSVAFDAALLREGTNVLKLRITGSSWVNSVLYDYLRLELDEAAKP